MTTLLLTSLAAFGASLLLTAHVRSFARRWDIVDRPDGRRKLHGRPVPLWGGLAVYATTLLGLAALHFSVHGSHEFSQLALAWTLAAGSVCIVGCIDDRYNLPSRIKLLLQIVSVLPIIAMHYSVDRIVAFGIPVELGWLGVPLTILWLVGCINALNLIDGMDGLASTIGLSTLLMLGIIAANMGHPHVAVIAIVMAAALSGFLVYNLPPASIFLGDSGSMVIGLTIGLLGIQGSLKTSATLAITAPVVVMTLPFFDIVAAIVRRKLTGRRFDAPDHSHIHHRLLDRGWSPWQVLCLLGALCLTTGAAATAATIFRRDALAWIAATTLVVLLVRLRLFGYVEFTLAKNAASNAIQLAKDMVERIVFSDGETHQSPAIQAHLSIVHAQKPEPPLPSPEEWDVLLANLRGWKIREMQFGVDLDSRPRWIRWRDPTTFDNRPCHWSLGVSLPGHNGGICELRVAASEPLTQREDVVALTSLLTLFGAHFANHAEKFFHSNVVLNWPIVIETEAESRRAA